MLAIIRSLKVCHKARKINRINLIFNKECTICKDVMDNQSQTVNLSLVKALGAIPPHDFRRYVTRQKKSHFGSKLLVKP